MDCCVGKLLLYMKMGQTIKGFMPVPGSKCKASSAQWETTLVLHVPQRMQFRISGLGWKGP